MTTGAGEWAGVATDGGVDGPSDDGGVDGPSDDGPSDDGPSDDEVVQAAAAAAEGLVFSRLRRSDVDDYDVTVTFEDGILEVDVYVEAPDAGEDTEQVAEDAALAARSAVDDLFGAAGE